MFLKFLLFNLGIIALYSPAYKIFNIIVFLQSFHTVQQSIFTAFLDTLMPRLYNHNVYMRIPYFRGSPGPSTGYTAFFFI